VPTYTLTAETGGFGWYHSWLLKDGTWNDAGWWADVAAWEPNEGINFGIGQAAGVGVFTVVGQGINEDIVERIEAGIFALSGQAAAKGITEAAGGTSYTLAGQDITESISEALEAGVFALAGQDAGKALFELVGPASFSLVGQDAAKSIAEALGAGVFVFNGVPITKNYSERVDAGSFALVGQDSGRGVIENLEAGRFFGDFAWALSNGFWNDEGWWLDTASWGANPGINFGISEIAGTGVFVLAGQDAGRGVIERGEVGVFDVVFIDAFPRKDRTERDGTLTSTIFASSQNNANFTHQPNRVIITALTPNEAA
jgi:hypothetical protein